MDKVFDKFKGYLDSRLEEVSSTHHGLNPRKVQDDKDAKKQQRETEAQKLKKKGNNKQFLFNAEVLDELKNITEELHFEDVDSALKTTKRAQNSWKGVKNSSNSPIKAKRAGLQWTITRVTSWLMIPLTRRG